MKASGAKGKFSVHPSLFILPPIAFFSGRTVFFLNLVLFLFLHEFFHYVAARSVNAEVKSFTLSALGFSAEFKDFEFLKTSHKFMLLMSGCAANLTAAGIIYLFFGDCAAYNANILIASVNLLPVRPLDCGRAVLAVAESWFGIVPANRLMRKTGKTVCLLVMFIGFARTVLYPYDLSVVIFGFFILKKSDKEAFSGMMDFYKIITLKQKKFCGRSLLPVRVRFAPSTLTLKKMLYSVSWDSYSVFYTTINDTPAQLYENELLEYVLKFSPDSRLKDITMVQNSERRPERG